MAQRLKRAKTLSADELERIVAAATVLHEALCRPLINVQSPHYKACRDLNEAIVTAIEAMTGEPPHWMRSSPANARLVYKGGAGG